MATNENQSAAREAGQYYLPTSKRVNSRTVNALQRAFDDVMRNRVITVSKGKHPFEIAVSPDCDERATFATCFAGGWITGRGF